MSKTTLRAGAALTAALALAAFTAPALGDDAGSGDAVRAAGLGTPVIVGPVDESAVPAAPTLIESIADHVVADLVAHAAAIEHLAAVQHLQAVQHWDATVAADEAREAEETRRAEEARRAEAEQAAAARSSAPAGSVEAIIQHHFGGAAGTAMRVARCESGLNPRAVSPGGRNHGLFQINSIHQGTFQSVTGQPWSAVYDADANTRFALWLYQQQGWGPWACA